MSTPYTEDGKVRPEELMLSDGIRMSDKEIRVVSDVYTDFYTWRSYRSGMILMFQGYNFEQYLQTSRELFWNSFNTPSQDLQRLDLQFAIPFARKESLDFLARLVSLNIKPKIGGDEVNALSIKMLQGMYNNFSFKNNERVEKFWELLYGIVNGTVCSYIGYNNNELTRRYLDSYSPETGAFTIREKKQKYWNDVTKEIVPLEDIFLPKIYERNFQKQGKVLWRNLMTPEDFHAEYGKYPMSKYVFPGVRIAEDSLFFRLLGGSGTSSVNKIEVMKKYDWITDEYKLVAGGLVLNKLGKGSEMQVPPLPFDHKMGPFSWGIMGALDEKLAYGLSTPFLVRQPHKILNTSFTMMVERELRSIDPPILTSDIEAPALIFGQNKVIPVGDVNAYKELNIKDPSSQYFSMMNSLQSNMTGQAQGGDANVVPSVQPKSAKEVSQNAILQQQAISNATTMYYDIIRQQVMLILKTALQFYGAEKYRASDKRVFRTMIAENQPLTQGGIGDLEIRFVKTTSDPDELFKEAIRKSVERGKTTEIIEMPVDFIQNLDFLVNNIDLEPDQTSELEMAAFVENVIQPMINVYVPAGVADISKVMARHLEKMQENISDYAPESVVAQMNGKGSAQNGGVPEGVQMNNNGSQFQNMLQSIRGTRFGSQNSKPIPQS